MKSTVFAHCLATIVALSSFIAHCESAPPRRGDIESYAKDGTLGQRRAFYESQTNHGIDSYLLARARVQDHRRTLMLQKALTAVELDAIAPIPSPAWRGLPTIGNVKFLALLIEFDDIKHSAANSRDIVHSAIFKDGNPARAPYESVRNFYRRSSFGKLTLDGETLGWYQSPQKRSEIEQTDDGRDRLIIEALQHYQAQGFDFAPYDNDRDGSIDFVLVVYAGSNDGWGRFWWTYENSFRAPRSTLIGGLGLSTYVFQYQNYEQSAEFDTRTAIHETGHALGLPDLYDTDFNNGPNGGVGGADMMDGKLGDHNAFSKWLLGWVEPTIIEAGERTLQLRPAGCNGDKSDTVVIAPPGDRLLPLSEFFLIQNRQKCGNDDDVKGFGAAEDQPWPGSGIAIWHVDARVDLGGYDFLYNNSSTTHKLLRLMEADGSERIQARWPAIGSSFFPQGSTFGDRTYPNSKRYDNWQYVGTRTNIFVRDVKQLRDSISITVGFDSKIEQVPRSLLKLRN